MAGYPRPALACHYSYVTSYLAEVESRIPRLSLVMAGGKSRAKLPVPATITGDLTTPHRVTAKLNAENRFATDFPRASIPATPPTGRGRS